MPRSAIRAGQRYPQVVQPGTSDRLAMGTASDGGGGETEVEPSEQGSSATDDAADSSPASGSSTATAATASGDGAGTTGDEQAQNVGQTRVFTPPDDADLTADGDATRAVAEDATKNEFCPICGETYEADAGHTNCPNCNAVLDEN
ncbi:hypothetical protein ACFQL4_15830 [Halosimplex aquaticum]